MSHWTYISGIIKVEPLGRTQAEKRYILDTVLDHLPQVTGSEGGMRPYIIQKDGTSTSCSHDEFGERTNNLTSLRGDRSRHGMLRMQDTYLLAIDSSLRDRGFEETFREFQNWICRLAKRVIVRKVMVEISGYERQMVVRDANGVYYAMFESPSWCRGSNEEPNWCEYLMWDAARNTNYPILLAYKYYADEENDEEAKRRINYSA